MTVYAITSLPFQQASPARLADLLRGHWTIEALHHLPDVTFCEDASQVRTGAAPHVLACLRNVVIGVLSRAGPVNVAAALRRHARDPRRPSPPSESASDEPTSRQDCEAPGRVQARSLASPRSSVGQRSRRRSQASNCAGIRTPWSSTAV